MLTQTFLMAASAVALGGFMGLERAIARTPDSIATHALASVLGLIGSMLVFVFALGVDDLDTGVTDALIVATALAFPAAALVRALLSLIPATDGRGQPSGDLVSLASAAWLGSTCICGSWRLIVLSLLGLVLLAIFRPRAAPPSSSVPSNIVSLSPMAPKIMIPAGLPGPQLRVVTRSNVALIEVVESDHQDISAEQSETSASERDEIAKLPLFAMLPSSGARPLAGARRRRRAGARHVRDARSLRGYSLRHHRGIRYGVIQA